MAIYEFKVLSLTCEIVVIIIELNVNQCCAFLRWAIFGRWECLGDKQYTIIKSVLSTGLIMSSGRRKQIRKLKDAPYTLQL